MVSKARIDRQVTVLLATTWATACGIAQHSSYLVESVEAADPEIGIVASKEALDPGQVEAATSACNLLHLNYHRALHSRWTPETVAAAKRVGWKVVITFHDTFGEHEPDSLSRALCAAADAFVVHEPCEGLGSAPSWRNNGEAIYWRMGVPGWQQPESYDWGPQGWTGGPRPILGSVGFPFPWKNYEKLAEATREAGWALLLIAPDATREQVLAWRTINPYLEVRANFVGRGEVVSALAGCDATAFAYTCANSGQSAAVLQGIAARKPVFAFETCRQFRALMLAEAPGELSLMRWGETFEDLQCYLQDCPIGRVDPRTVALAERDSWAKLGVKYAELYRRVAGTEGGQGGGSGV